MRRPGFNGHVALSLLLAFAFLSVGCGSSAGGEAGDQTDAETSPSVSQVPNVEVPNVDESTVEPAPGALDQAVEELFPDVLEATAEKTGDGVWTFSATLSSPYDTPERYADGWRVVGPDGTVYGERPLAHDHQFEQPFTRSQSGIEIPADVTEVTVQGRDQVSGWGGETVQVRLVP